MSDILQNLVQEDFGYKHEGRTWGRAEEHSSLVVDEDNQRWYWNSENKGGDVLSYLIQIRGYSKKKATEILENLENISRGILVSEKKEHGFYTPYEKMVNTFWESGKTNREYWYNRKLKDGTIDRYRLGYFDGWYFVPLYLNGKFVNFQCRRDVPDKKIRLWYREEKWTPVLINADLLNFVDAIFITEGTIDAILLTQEGLPSVSQTAGAVYWSPYWYPYFSRVKKIYYIADNDDAGRKAATRVATCLGEDRTLIYQFEGKKDKYDTVDFFRDGGTVGELKSLIEHDSKYLFELGELNEYRTRHRRRNIPLAR